jgi:predicted RNA-binding protein with EMAP domain
MEFNVLPEAIEKAYRNLQNDRNDLYMASKALINFRQKIEARKMNGYERRKIRGNNAEERKVSEFYYIEDMVEELCELEEAERWAKHRYDQAGSEVEMIKQLLRLQELQK